jgi:hypothetical protein
MSMAVLASIAELDHTAGGGYDGSHEVPWRKVWFWSCAVDHQSDAAA